MFLTTVAALALTACGSVPGMGAPTLKEEDSPLMKYLAVFNDGPGMGATQQEQQAWANEQQSKTEKLVAECMTKEGFEYVPNVNAGRTVVSFDDYKPNDREWVSKYGYGMVNSPGREEGQGGGPSAPPEDPNATYLESLSPAEQQAYNEAMWGKMDDQPVNDSGDAEPWDWRKGGCQGAAQHEVYGRNSEIFQGKEFQALFESINELYTSVSQSAQMTDLNSAWAKCMDQAGHGGFKNPGEASSSISELLNEYYENMFSENPDPKFGTPDDPEFAKIGTEKEIPLALADLDCRVETDFSNQEMKARFEAEKQFIEDHRQELDALVAAAEQARK